MSNTITQKTITWGNGQTSLYAGTPLDTNGKPANDGSAVGVLAEDIHMPDRSASVLTAGVWDEDAHTDSGIILSDAAKAAMSGITFKHPPVEYVQKSDLATTSKAGIVKQGASIAAIGSNPTKADFNGLLTKLKNAGVITPDSFNVSVLACPTPAVMPTSETAANSGHATLSINEGEITIALDCKVSELADADHGASWGSHKWIGFGIRTGLASVVGVKFTDDTGASATLSADDASEASDLGLSAGDFILYIKAEQAKYLTGEKYFTLEADGYAPVTVTMKITET